MKFSDLFAGLLFFITFTVFFQLSAMATKQGLEDDDTKELEINRVYTQEFQKIRELIRDGDILALEKYLDNHPQENLKDASVSALAWKNFDLFLVLVIRLKDDIKDDIFTEMVLKKNVEAVRHLLTLKEIDVNTTIFGGPAITYAAKTKNPALPWLAKHEGIMLNEKDGDGNTALMNCIIHNNEEGFDILYKMPGVDINAQNEKGETALMLAAAFARKTMVQKLLSVVGVAVDLRDGRGLNAFFHAADFLSGNDRIIQQQIQTLLIAAGSSREAASFSDRSFDSMYPEITQEGLRINAAIAAALDAGNLSELNSFVQLGYTLNIKDTQGLAIQAIINQSKAYANEDIKVQIMQLLKQHLIGVHFNQTEEDDEATYVFY